METSVPIRTSVWPLLRSMLKHLCSVISHGGARRLADIQVMLRKELERYVIRLTKPSRCDSLDRQDGGVCKALPNPVPDELVA